MEAPRWVELELGEGTQFGNRKLNKRLVKIVAHLSEQPNESVPQACGDWKDTKGTYRFWDHKHVTPEKILEPHVRSTVVRAEKQRVVLAVQDTTELNFTSHLATQGLGMLDHRKCRGLKVHSVFAVSDKGVPLGLLHQKVWTRDPKSRKNEREYQKLAIAQKESQRWLDGQKAAETQLSPRTQIVTVGDRESDIFDLFVQTRRPGSDLLVRVQAKRRLVLHPARYLDAAVRRQQPLGTKVVQVPRKDGTPRREARLTIRAMSLEILPPQNHPRRDELHPIRVQVILAEEEHPPKGTKPLSWLLATSLSADTLEDALRCVEYYTYRWLIERFHFVLKSGCGMEDMQLETAARLKNALATKSIVAWRLLWVTYQARVEPDGSATQVVTDEEWHILCHTQKKGKATPALRPTIREAVRLIARLGGFLGRKHDGEPGVKTLWRGLQRLQDRVTGWHLSRSITHEKQQHCSA